MLELLRDLVMTPGAAGHEGTIRERIRREIEYLGEVKVDGKGNLLLMMGRGEKHAVVIAHMDEVALMVADIESNGHIRVAPLGGPDDRVCIGRAYDIITAKGHVPGVIGLVPPHLMRERSREMRTVIPIDDLVMDIGVRSDKEALELGVRRMDPIIFRKDFMVMNREYVATRSLDDRAGCCAIICAAKAIAAMKPGLRITFVWSVQEELGLRGGRVVANLLRPEYVIPVDTSSSADIPGIPYHFAPFRLGDGPLLRMMDKGLISSARLRDLAVAVAEKNGIPVQVSHTSGTTDGSAMQDWGADVLPICIPLRYTHSPVEVLHLGDLEKTARLLVEFLLALGS